MKKDTKNTINKNTEMTMKKQTEKTIQKETKPELNKDIENTMNQDKGGYFYERKYPERDELVMVRVNSIDEDGVFCSLLEYNNIEGFLQLKELSRKTYIKSIKRFVRVGQQQVLQVLTVDSENGYIDLSKKYITEEEREAGNEKYNKGKTVHNITKRVAETTNKELEEVYTTYVWPLYETHDHPFDAFKALAAHEGEQADIWKDLPDTVPEIKNAFIHLIEHQMAVQPVKIGAQIEVMCYSEEGIDDIKRALKAGIEINRDSLTPVKIHLISSPLYLVWTTTLDEDAGSGALNEVIEEIKSKITKFGSMKIIKQPSVIGKVDP
jgi:translation initiation factor 2 subunit 1